MDKRTVIPDNPAGRRAFDVLRGIAERMWAVGQDMTADYAAETNPQATTINEEYAHGKYTRTMRDPNGAVVKIAYDYRARAVLILSGKEAQRDTRKVFAV